MLTIGEFARLAGVSVRMLRHYDSLGLLLPAEVDRFSGYRRYRPEQLSRAHQLVALKELGFTLEQVGELLDQTASDQVRGLLETRKQELAEQIDRDSGRLVEVERRLRLVEGDSQMEFTLTSLPEVRLAQLTGEVSDQPEIAGVIGPLFERLTAAYDGRLPGPSLAWYAGDGERLRLGAGVEERGHAPSGVGTETLPAEERAVVTTYRGPISGIGDAWQALGAHLAEEGLATGGICREVYHQVGERNTDEWVVELQQPLA